MEIIRTPFRAPNANAVAGRWIRSAREECLDHLLLLGERHVHRVLREYVTFFNEQRPHQGPGLQCPIPLPPPPGTGSVRRVDVLGGIIHDYECCAAQRTEFSHTTGSLMDGARRERDMAERYDAAWVAGMLSPARAALSPPETLLVGAGVGDGATVVDLGCGPGFFTLPAARLVGAAGHVYAVDVEPHMLALVAERAAAEGPGTVTTVAAQGATVPLPAACADVVVCALVLHDLAEPERQEMAREIARLCRPGGRALIVEWQPHRGDTRGNRLAPPQITLLLEEAGLCVEETAPLGAADQGTAEGGYEGMYSVVAWREQ